MVWNENVQTHQPFVDPSGLKDLSVKCLVTAFCCGQMEDLNH